MQTAEFLAAAGASGSTMHEGRQNDAVPSMAVANCWIHQQQAAMGCAQRDCGLGEKSSVAAEYRRRQRTASASRDRESIRFVAIGNDGHNGPEDFQFVDHLSVHTVVKLQQVGGTNAPLAASASTGAKGSGE